MEKSRHQNTMYELSNEGENPMSNIMSSLKGLHVTQRRSRTSPESRLAHARTKQMETIQSHIERVERGEDCPWVYKHGNTVLVEPTYSVSRASRKFLPIIDGEEYPSLDVGDMSNVVSALKTLYASVEAGEQDKALEKVMDSFKYVDPTEA